MTDPGALASMDRLAEAFAYAEAIHRGQTRKKTLAPVLSHLMAVAALVLENGGDEEEAMAALLHDGPEDCDGRTTLDEIRSRFGERVAAIVLGCTDSLDQPRPAWHDRKRRYLAHLPDADPSVLLVSLADKVHNVRSLAREHRRIGSDLWSRFRVPRERYVWYYRSLVDIYRVAATPRTAPLIAELERALTELETSIAESQS